MYLIGNLNLKQLDLKGLDWLGFDWKRDGWKGLDLFGKVWIGWIGLGRI